MTAGTKSFFIESSLFFVAKFKVALLWHTREAWLRAAPSPPHSAGEGADAARVPRPRTSTIHGSPDFLESPIYVQPAHSVMLAPTKHQATRMIVVKSTLLAVASFVLVLHGAADAAEIK